jgi:hypothetical protein
MGSNSQTTDQKQNQTTNPWAPAIPGLTNIINQLGGGGAPLTAPQSSAVNNLQTEAAGVPSFGAQGSNAVQGLFNSTTAPQIGTWNNAYNLYNKTLTPYTQSGYTDPMTAPGIGTALGTVNEDVTNQVKGMFAAAGRDPAGNADASKALARGLAQGEAPILTSEYNALVGQQQGAAGGLLSGAGSTASGTAQLGQIPLMNSLQGIGAAGSLPGLWTMPGATQLGVANIGQQLPYQNLQLPASMLGGIASLGGQGTNTGTSTTSQPVNPWTTGAGLGLGILGLSGGNGNTVGGNMFSSLGLSDRRLKEDIEPIGLLFNGLSVYKYRFRGSPKTEVGVMAQDVEKVRPDAVVDVGLWRGGPSVKMVDYDKATSPIAMAA